MEKITKTVSEVMNRFVEQEQGNKVTVFNMQGLTSVLLAELAKVTADQPKKK